MHPDFGVLGRRGPPRQPALGAIGPGVAADDGRGRQVTLKTANIGTAVDVEATLAAPPPTRSTRRHERHRRIIRPGLLHRVGSVDRPDEHHQLALLARELDGHDRLLGTDIAFGLRAYDLSKGGGLNGSAVLNASTVTEDSQANTLDSGTGEAWFIAHDRDRANSASGTNLRTIVA